MSTSTLFYWEVLCIATYSATYTHKHTYKHSYMHICIATYIYAIYMYTYAMCIIYIHNPKSSCFARKNSAIYLIPVIWHVYMHIVFNSRYIWLSKSSVCFHIFLYICILKDKCRLVSTSFFSFKWLEQHQTWTLFWCGLWELYF